MDATDIRILGCLKKNGRATASFVAKSVNMSVSAVAERIRRLEKSGVISGYTVIVDQKKLGLGITALMEVSLEHPKYYDVFAKLVRTTPSIISCYYLTGHFDFMLKLYADSSEELERIHRKIKGTEGVGVTRTHVVLESLKNELSYIPEQ